jgi:polyisoprenoid-binding protein YceI
MKKYLVIPAVLVLATAGITAFRPLSSNNKSELKLQDGSVALPVDATTWKVDKVHSNIIFSVSHLVVPDVEGSFKSFDGALVSSKPDFSDAVINFTVDVASVNTDNEMRDKHLKSDDFFNADKFPQMKFVSTSFQPSGDGKYTLTGNLTIRDITKPVSFDVKYGGTAVAMGGTHIGFKAKATINRFDYNLKWSATTEAGGLVVGKDVDITVNLDLKKS